MRKQNDTRRRTSRPHLPFVRQSRLKLLARVLGVFDVDELLVHRRRVVESGLPAAIYAGHRRPDADGAPEVIGHVHRHHVLHTQAEVCRALDLERVRSGTFSISVYLHYLLSSFFFSRPLFFFFLQFLFNYLKKKKLYLFLPYLALILYLNLFLSS